jgi:uncharacterized protein YyaL (SSP411 family)
MFRFSVRPNQAHLIEWREWGPEAFQRAQDQNKPVMVFIAAFWCGFCQRMDETSLSEDDAITLLNAFFVPIRVEESQRPDVDLRYNQGGWPTIVFMAPDSTHLFSVNFMEPESFVNLLVKIVTLHQQGETIVEPSAVQADAQVDGSADTDSSPLGPDIVAEIAGMVEGLADKVNGGYGSEFKFLHPEANDFLLYLYETSGESSHLDHVRFTLDKMRQSKTFDTEGGGFFRYSSKADWSEPHPEKLLDDQAALLSNHLRAYLLTQDQSYRETALGLIEYLDTVLSNGQGGLFQGCQDYVREDRDAPSSAMLSVIDEYLYCDANARAASAYLDAWWILGLEACRERAREVLELLWDTLRSPDGAMHHYWHEQPQVPGLLGDAAETGLALLHAYSTLHEDVYLRRAEILAESIGQRHRDHEGGFNDISVSGPASLSRPMKVLAQNARLAVFFVKLADVSGQEAYREQAVWALKSFPNTHRNYGAFAAGFGHALARLLSLPVIVTVVGAPGDPSVLEMARAALTQLGWGDLVLQFQENRDLALARAEIQAGAHPAHIVSKPSDLTHELILELIRS